MFEMNQGPRLLADLQPWVEVVYDYEGKLDIGTEVTASALVHNLPDSFTLSYQWQNDAGGSFQDVVGAKEQAITFVVDTYQKIGCSWRVNVTIESYSA